MSDKVKGNLGIVCAVCVVLIVLGAVAGWQLYEIYSASSEIYGAPNEVVEGFLELSDDESVFFSYKIDALSFDYDNSGNYTQTIVFEKLDYDYDAYSYDFYINGAAAGSYSTVGSIVANIDYLFYAPNGAEYNAPLEVELTFLNDRTELKLTVTERELTGYLNQMTKSGLKIVVVAGAPGDSLEYAGEGNINGVYLDKTEIVF